MPLIYTFTGATPDMMAAIAKSCTPATRHSWLYLLLACVLFRAIIPVGFMPGEGKTGSITDWITLCYGNFGSAQLLRQSATVDDHHHLHHQHAPADAASADRDGDSPTATATATADHSYCLFAGALFNGSNPNHSLDLIDTSATSASGAKVNVNILSPYLQPQTRAPPTALHAPA